MGECVDAGCVVELTFVGRVVRLLYVDGMND